MTLLREIQTLLERTYAPLPINLETCLIGEARCALLNRLAGASAAGLRPGGRTFLRLQDDSLHIAIFYPRRLIARLEADDPRLGLNERNIAPLITFIEEIAHGVQAALLFGEGERAIGSDDFLCNLEAQARIDTYLVLSKLVHALTGGRPPRRVARWLRRQLFDGAVERFPTRRLRQRYGSAQACARRFLRHLARLPLAERPKALRHFRALTWRGKWRHLREKPTR